MTWVSLSERYGEDERDAGPFSGVPPWLTESVVRWVRPFFFWYQRGSGSRSGRSHLRIDVVRTTELALRLNPPLDWSRSDGTTAYASLIQRVQGDDQVALDLVDYLLADANPQTVKDLNETLTLAGSIWQAVASPADGIAYCLARRTAGPIEAVLDAARPLSERADRHLREAWIALVGRSPTPSTAYRESIRAIEVVAKPVVSPNNPRATLGTMIADLRNKPEKWTFVLEGGTVENVADDMAMLWTSQLDRHGTDDDSVPLNVSQEQADAAFHLAIGLVRLFAGGLVKPA